MNTYSLLCAALAVDVIVLIIGVVAAYLRIPYAVEIISAALGTLAILVHAISRTVSPGHSNRNGRQGGAKSC